MSEFGKKSVSLSAVYSCRKSHFSCMDLIQNESPLNIRCASGTMGASSTRFRFPVGLGAVEEGIALKFVACGGAEVVCFTSENISG